MLPSIGAPCVVGARHASPLAFHHPKRSRVTGLGTSLSSPDFGQLAESYDRLRPVDDNWRELLEVLVEEGDLVGRRVLDVGCGTGRLALAFAERGSRPWGVDPSEEMLAAARAGAGRSVRFKQAAAESLPFKDGSFERAVMRQVVHLVERPRSLRELHRVLAPDGRAVIATFRPEHVEHFWLNEWFPSIETIDRRRFPPPDALAGELEDAGFGTVRIRLLDQTRRATREESLERIRGRFISTLQLLPEDEYRAGLARAERELPAQIVYALEWAILVAERPTARRASAG